MTRFERRTDPWIYVAIVLAATAVFVGDLLTELGVAVWIFYLIPVALCLLTTRPGAPLFVATACTAGMVIGYFSAVSAPGGVTRSISELNRMFGLLIMWGFAVMARQILSSQLALHKQAWLRTGQNLLAERTRGDIRIEHLAASVLQFLAAHLDAQVATFYVRDGARLRRAAGFGLASDGAPAASIAFGEGLLGQAALDARSFHVHDLPEHYLKVSSSLGAATPGHIAIAPLHADGEVNGVLELGFLRAAHASDLELLDLLLEPIGIAVRSANDRTHLEDLLEKTQRQAGELQAQQEELRVANEELEEHGRALRESQARLELQQSELEQTNSHLEEQTSLLTQQKTALESAQAVLTEKSEELERANRYKSEFLANMSHELRTPLNSSLILAKLLADNKDGNLTPAQVKFAQTIHSAGSDLLDLINDILDLAKIEAGRMEVAVEPVRLAPLAEALARIFRPLADEKRIAFSASVAAGAPDSIETDAQRLRQILKNLLSNAIKFTDAGEVSLTIAPDGPDGLRFAVRDTGIGIPPGQQHAIFEAFRQADGTTNRKYGGTGLGLSISRDLAALLGGAIELESEANAGSTFTLRLPARYRAAAPPVPPPAAPRAAAATAAASGPAPAAAPARRAAARASSREAPADDDRDRVAEASRTLLVIEDDEAFARILYDLAHELGFDCLIAAGADEGFDLALGYRPAAIVLDMNLPDHSGLTVLNRLKSNPATRHIPVQVASIEDHTQAALEMGAAGYMLKPVDREQMMSALSRLESRLKQEIHTVLVVEDDSIQRESICALLAGQDVRPVPVATATEALEELRTATHDCMVLDMSLPDASGFDLLEQMAAGEQYSFPPVIVYTGRELSTEEEQRLRRYSRSIIIKGARSPERLLDEVTLFLHQVESTLPPDRRRMLAEARSREAAFEGRTILVAEDDVRTIFALSSVLEPRGATLKIARNGKEAVAAVQAEARVDMVLMDIMMPEMDGYEAMREIRERLGLRDLPIIALTAKAMRDDCERCLASGANDYIAKPIDIEQLLSLMRVWMPR
ncbi:MAG: response regulator [Acidobacteria bacterium]|nr:response regulator [Acidobacteriota bacterium]